jgi:hypothetical protein
MVKTVGWPIILVLKHVLEKTFSSNLFSNSNYAQGSDVAMRGPVSND